MAPTSPTLAAWALGLRMREKRVELGLAGAKGAKLGGVASAYLSDVERGRKVLSAGRLETFVVAYEFDAEEAQELREFREQATQRGWWSKYSAVFSEELLRFFGCEHGAENVHAYDSGLVNGLLQTEDYARSVVEAARINLRMAEVERRVKCRMLRQERLWGDDPLVFATVMSEAALRQRVGGTEVIREQLVHLANVINDYPETVDVRVIPFESPGHDALGGSSFSLMTFPSGELPAALWQETVTSTQLIADPMTVREYSLTLGGAREQAMSRENSLAFIEKASKAM